MQLVSKVAGAHEPVLVAFEREAVAALEVRHARLDLNEHEPSVLELHVSTSDARRERYEVDPVAGVHPYLLSDEGELPPELLLHLLGQFFGHITAVHSPSPTSLSQRRFILSPHI